MSSLRRRWARWRRRRDRDNEVNAALLELREFIYLDEVSVVSLLSSRLGKLPSEFTDTLTTSSKAGVNSGLAVNVGVAKSELGSSLESIHTEDTKVVSKATVQATFKQLYQHEIGKGTLAIRPAARRERGLTVGEARALLNGEATDDEWQIDIGGLHRGQLAEFEVELHADSRFRVSAIISTFAEIAKDSKELLAQIEHADLDRVIELNKVLEKLMAGLVPLKSRLVDYTLVDGNGGERLVHRRVLEVLPKAERPASTDVYLVGVAEKSLFWKDIRRVLFTKDRFRILCRLNDDGLTASWMPVKLVDVLSEVAPDLGEAIDVFSPETIKEMADKSSSHGKFLEPRVGALTLFGDLLAERLKVALSDESRERIKRIAAENADFLISVPEGRKAFREIETYLREQASDSINIDDATVANIRVEACRRYELYPGGSPIYDRMSTIPTPTSRTSERYLNCEVVAIYW